MISRGLWPQVKHPTTNKRKRFPKSNPVFSQWPSLFCGNRLRRLAHELVCRWCRVHFDRCLLEVTHFFPFLFTGVVTNALTSLRLPSGQAPCLMPIQLLDTEKAFCLLQQVLGEKLIIYAMAFVGDRVWAE